MSSTISIVDYGVGNVRSVLNAIERIDSVIACVTNKRETILASDGIILPGVGSFDAAAKALRDNALKPVLDEAVLIRKKPILAICVGMQLLYENSEEGERQGLSWLPGKISKFEPSEEFSVPHFGWNQVKPTKENLLFQNIEQDRNFYFAHSFSRMKVDLFTIATTDHGVQFTSAVQNKNIFGTQFHPEKSHQIGLKLLRNFTGIVEQSKCSKID